MNPKFAKLLVKLAISLAGSVVLGYTYKTEKTLQTRIDEHYDPKTDQIPK